MPNKLSKKKLPWKSIEITKVKLNPEQAVLACCDSGAKDQVSGPNQCEATPPCFFDQNNLTSS